MAFYPAPMVSMQYFTASGASSIIFRLSLRPRAVTPPVHKWIDQADPLRLFHNPYFAVKQSSCATPLPHNRGNRCEPP